MRQRGERGPVVIIGGAEDRGREAEVLRAFVRIAGGAQATISIIAAASEIAPEIAADYVKVFRRLGAAQVSALEIEERADAEDAQVLAAVEHSTGVFFTGGSQLRITRVLAGTRCEALLHRMHARGLVLAGTSAGAAMMSGVMIAGGPPARALRMESVELSHGMRFVPGVIIDQHFEERGRLRRLLSAVARHPQDLGLGVDENTAAVVSGGRFEVVGAGAVTVIDASCLTHTNLGALDRGQLLALCGVKIHVLPAGYGFDLGDRTPIAPTLAHKI